MSMCQKRGSHSPIPTFHHRCCHVLLLETRACDFAIASSTLPRPVSKPESCRLSTSIFHQRKDRPWNSLDRTLRDQSHFDSVVIGPDLIPEGNQDVSDCYDFCTFHCGTTLSLFDSIPQEFGPDMRKNNERVFRASHRERKELP